MATATGFDWNALGANLQTGFNNLTSVAQGVIGARTALANLKNTQTTANQNAAMNQAQINALNLQNQQQAQALAAQQNAPIATQTTAPAGMSTTTMLMIGGGLVAVLGAFLVLKK